MLGRLLSETERELEFFPQLRFVIRCESDRDESILILVINRNKILQKLIESDVINSKFQIMFSL